MCVKVGRYEVLSELGRGGMASVMLARAPGGSLVVLKVPLNDDPDTHERLRDEARTGLRLAHPHIVETLDMLELDGKPVLVLSYVSGASMYELRTRGALPPAVVLRVGRQIADALDAIHHASDERGRSLGILHRDVTAGNVMLGEDGDARLIDLGIAKSVESQAARTKSGCMRGTLRYIAPELFTGGRFSPASDLWSLGIVLLEASLGRTSFPGKNDAEIVLRIVEAEPLKLLPRESLDGRVKRALEQLLAKDPARRPARGRDAAALLGMLEKDFADTCAQAQRAVRRCLMTTVEEPKGAARDKSRVSTEVLVERASRTYGSSDIELLDERVASYQGDVSTEADDSDDIGYAETDRLEGSVSEAQPLAAQPDSLDPTGHFHVPSFARPPYRTAHDAILAYARQLRDFEHTRRAKRMPKSETSGEVVA